MQANANPLPHWKDVGAMKAGRDCLVSLDLAQTVIP